MATFNFSTITTAQALAFTAADTLLIDQGPANATTVLFQADTTIAIVVGTTTVTFGAAVASGTITYNDGSRLFIGTSGNDSLGGASGSDGLYGGAGFPLNGVIPCWTEAVQLMKVGGKARIVCPSELAYGERGSPPQIRPGSTLVFQVELLDIVKPGAAGAAEAPANPHQ